MIIIRGKKYNVVLSDDEVSYLEGMLRGGVESARKLRRARTLLMAASGETNKNISKNLNICSATVTNTRKRFCLEGLEAALGEKPRSGTPAKITDDIKAQVSLLACTNPPEGRSRWTLRLLADTIVEMELVEHISHEKVRQILKKTS